MKGFYKHIRRLMVFICRVVFRFRIENAQNIPTDKNYVVCCNHLSFFDPVFIAVAEKKRTICFLAKESVLHIFLIGPLFKKFHVIPVSRDGKGNISAVKSAQAAFKSGNCVGIFPEGTRSKDGKLHNGRSGAAMIAHNCNADVLPCALVVSNGKVRPFKKITLRYGKLIPASEIQVEGISHADLRAATRRIMGDIADLLPEELK